MKRFMVFSGDYYYPLGGMQDFDDSYETLEEAQDRVRRILGRGTSKWASIYDLEKMKEVGDPS